MTVSLMQPYFFPYLGYFQLMAAADKFVLYDDVAYRKGGFINRNRLLDPATGTAWFFTMPVRNASPNRNINQLEIGGPARWKDGLLRRFTACYAAARNYAVTKDLVATALQSKETNLAVVLRQSILAVRDFLGLKTPVVESSALYANQHLAGVARVIDIAKKEGATTYLNAEGGRLLYRESDFHAAGLALRFIQHREHPYSQLGGHAFVQRLSVLDAMLHCAPSDLREALSAYTIS